jgi:hypothetical protein
LENISDFKNRLIDLEQEIYHQYHYYFDGKIITDVTGNRVVTPEQRAMYIIVGFLNKFKDVDKVFLCRFFSDKQRTRRILI